MSKRFRWSAITILLASLIIYGLLSVLLDESKERVSPSVIKPLPTVATAEYLEPTKEHPRGRVEKYHYRYGTLIIDRKYRGHGRLSPGRLFAVLNVAWPKFEGAGYYYSSEKSQRLRMLFEINHRHTGYKDIYNLVHEDLNELGGQDFQYKDFIGYRQKYDWIYLTTDPNLLMPQGTPVTVSCSVRGNRILPSGEFGAECKYILIFDEELKARVQFDKKLMKDFSQVHKDL